MLDDPTTVQLLIKARIQRNNREAAQQRQYSEAISRRNRKERLQPASGAWKHRFLARIIHH